LPASTFQKPWVYHCSFWVSYYLFGAMISLSIHQVYDGRFYWQLLTLLPPDMLLVYANLYLLMPAFLVPKRFVLYLLSLAGCISVVSIGNIGLHHLYSVLGSPFFAGNSTLDWPDFAVQVFNGIYLVGITTALKFLKDWLSQQQRLREIERQQVATELAFLVAQIHPHFFFNTLNNLYSLTLQRSELAPEVVLKLSALMSYMLYESAAAEVPLDKEIDNLENYIALERLRFGDRLSLSFEKEGLGSRPVHIPPLILLAFVENSFKHGLAKIPGNGHIRISLQILPQELIFRVENPLSSDKTADEKNGIGFQNVTRRLDLLYGTRYFLHHSAAGNTYHVTLKLPLT
jgi:two-component system, LytTR family, sensor kinase